MEEVLLMFGVAATGAFFGTAVGFALYKWNGQRQMNKPMTITRAELEQLGSAILGNTQSHVAGNVTPAKPNPIRLPKAKRQPEWYEDLPDIKKREGG